MSYSYKRSVLGGTFDNFHLGHEKLIDTAFANSEQVTVGITLPELYKHKFLAETIEGYAIRKEKILKYLEEKNYLQRAKIIAINNIYGSTIEEKDIDAIFATQENAENVALINNKRQEIGFPELKIIIVPYVNDENGKKITSERIRKGEIDRNGQVFQNIFADKDLVMPESLRAELHKPLGEIFSSTQAIVNLIKNKFIITVGDIITTEVKKIGLIPAISIIDFKTRRQELPQTEIINSFKTINNQGTINKEAVKVLTRALEQYFQTNSLQTIIVVGEEDLLALSAILLAPLGAIVLYGQFDEGIVVNGVTQKLKQNILQLLKKFE